jgi:hypothetical protein
MFGMTKRAVSGENRRKVFQVEERSSQVLKVKSCRQVQTTVR